MYSIPLSTLDILIIVGFMLLTLIVGIKSGKGMKSIRDYAVAGQSYGTPILLMTLTATLIGGGSTTGTVAEFYEVGIVFLVAMLGDGLSCIVAARFIAPKFDSRFDGMISAGDIIRKYYGRAVERFSALVVCVSSLGVISAQLIALGHIMQTMLGIPFNYAVCMMGAIMIAYSTFGGIKAVTMTDVLQFAILVVTIPILAQVALSNAGDFSTMFQKVAEMDSSKMQVFGSPYLVEYCFLFVLYAMPELRPHVVQRFLMFKNKKHIVKTLYGYSFMAYVLLFMCICIAFSAMILLDDVEPKAIIPTFISMYLPVGIKGLVIAGMIAAIMSTADSYLNTASILFAHNLLPKDFDSMKWAKFATVLVGTFALFVALFDVNIVMLVASAGSLLFIGVTLPIILVILACRVNKVTYWLTIAAAFPIFFIGKFIMHQGFNALLLSTAVAIITAIVSIFITNRGKFAFNTPAAGGASAASSSKPTNNLNRKNSVAKWKQKFLEDMRRNTMPFAIFALTAFTLPYFMWSPSQHFTVVLRTIAGFLCILLLFRDYYPQKMKNYYPQIWVLSLIYCLPFMTTITLLVETNNLWQTNLALAIFLLAALVDWLSFVILAFVGIILGYTYVMLFESIYFVWDSSTVYPLVYTMIFATIIGFVFNRYRERRTEEKIDNTEIFAEAIAHEVKSPIVSASMNLAAADDLLSIVRSSKGKKLTLTAEETNQFRDFCQNASNSLQLGLYNVDVLLMSAMNPSTSPEDLDDYAISDVINAAIAQIHVAHPDFKDRIKVKYISDFVYHGSAKLVHYVILNLLNNAVKYALKPVENATVTIVIDADHINVEDTGPGIKPGMENSIFTKGSATHGTGLGLAFCKHVMKSMGGDIQLTKESVTGVAGASFILNFEETYPHSSEEEEAATASKKSSETTN